MHLVNCWNYPKWLGEPEYSDGDWSKPNPRFHQIIDQECGNYPTYWQFGA